MEKPETLHGFDKKIIKTLFTMDERRKIWCLLNCWLTPVALKLKRKLTREEIGPMLHLFQSTIMGKRELKKIWQMGCDGTPEKWGKYK